MNFLRLEVEIRGVHADLRITEVGTLEVIFDILGQDWLLMHPRDADRLEEADLDNILQRSISLVYGSGELISPCCG